jgi:hypothetical protein
MYLAREYIDGLVYALVRTTNIDIQSSAGGLAFAHFDVSQPYTTTGTDRTGYVCAQTLVTTTAPTNLATAIPVASALASTGIAHINDKVDSWGAGAHRNVVLAADTTFKAAATTFIGYGSNATLTQLETFLTAYKTWGAAHVADGSATNTAKTHPYVDGGAWVAALAGGSVGSSSIANDITFIALCVTFSNSHNAAALGGMIRVVSP